MDIGFREILLILVIILILFGAKRIPEVMKAMGQGVKEFKKAAKDIQSDDDSTPSSQSPASTTKTEPPKSA
jgi:sec-independent protein translocase protein TatA